MFVLNSYPENGFISQESHVMFKLGLNKEKCLEKIHNADNRFAFSLLNIEENLYNANEGIQRHSSETFSSTSHYPHTTTGGRSANRLRSFDEMILRGFLNANRLNCKNYFLIVFSLVDDDLDSIITTSSLNAHKQEELLRK